MLKRALAAAAALMIGACTPPAAEAPARAAPPTQSSAPFTDLLDTLTPMVSAEIGQPVSLGAPNVRIADDWAFVAADPLQADGAAMDWSQTALASRDANGVLGSNGRVYALLRREAGVWTVVEHVIGPTDLAWSDWATRFGAPEELFAAPLLQNDGASQ